MDKKHHHHFNKTAPSWGVCTVCLPRESLYWLKDWIHHHHLCGASKIVIYDNTGSMGSSRQSSVFRKGTFQQQGISKRGEPYGQLTARLSDDRVKALLKGIAEQYGDLVELVEWQPKDPETGMIVHGQVEAYVDFIRRYRGILDWAAFIDMDEYLYMKPGLTVKYFLETVESELPLVSLIQLRAWRFECRWSQTGPKRIETLRQHLPLTWGGEKNLLRLTDVTHGNIHWDWRIKDGRHRIMAHPEDMAFCHYNQKPETLEKDAIVHIQPRLFLDEAKQVDGTVRFTQAIQFQGTEYATPLPI